MARVPTYGERKVTTAALPGVRKRNADTYESLGGTVGEAASQQGRVIAGLGAGIFEKAQQQERQRADDVKNLETVRAFNDLDHKLLYSEDQGILNKRGLEPHELQEKYLEDFDNESSRISGNLRTDRQRLFFEQEKIRRRDAFRNRANEHALKQLDAYEAETFKSTMTSSVNAAIAAGGDADFARVNGELQFQLKALKQHGSRMGMPPAAQELMRDELEAKVHGGIVEKLLAKQNDKGAAEYFAQTKDLIARGDPDAVERIEKAVNEGVLLGRAQRKSDAIIATAKTPADARAQAKQIPDPKERQATLELVEHELAVKDRQDREAHEAMTLKGLNIVERTGRLSSIPPAELSQYTVGERSALKNYLDDKARGIPTPTDPSVFSALIGMASSADPDVRQKFQELNPLSLVDKLSPSDFQEVVKLQASTRKGDVEKANALLVNPAAQNQMVNEALVTMGLPTNPVEPGKDNHDPVEYDRINQFRRAVREAVIRFEQTDLKGQRKASDTEVQSIVDQLRTRTGKGARVLKARPFYPDKYGDAYAFEEAQAQADDVNDIPAGERRRLEDALKAEGIAVTDTALLKYFNLRLSITRKDR